MIGIGWRSQRKRIFTFRLICHAKYTEVLYRRYLKVEGRNISDGFTCAETVLRPQRALEGLWISEVHIDKLSTVVLHVVV